MNRERGQPDDLANFERLAANCNTLCEDAPVDSSTADVGSLVFEAEDVNLVLDWKDEIGPAAECEADNFLSNEAIESYFEGDIFVLDKNEHNICVCENEAADIIDRKVEIIVSEKEEGEIEEDNYETVEAEDNIDFPHDKENEQNVKYESSNVEEREIETVVWEKEYGKIDEDGTDHEKEAHFGGDVLVPAKKIEQCLNYNEASKVEREIDMAVGEIKNDDSIEEEDSEDADTDEEEDSEEVSEDDDTNEFLYSENEEEEEIGKLGNATDTDEEAAYNDYINPIRSTNELVTPPSVKSVDATLQPHHQLQPIGIISSIVGAQVIVEGNDLHNPLNEGSILWITESKLPLGIIDEIFGPVKNPFYLVRFNSENDVPSQIQTGTPISFVDEFSKHILNNSIMNRKGYDASGENDEEVSDDGEFSDDEKEAEFKRKQKLSKRTHRDTKQKTDRMRAPKWKDNRRRTAADSVQTFNSETHFPPMETPVWNGGASYGPPQNAPLSYGIPPRNSPLPYGISSQNSPLPYGIPLLNPPLPCGIPAHDLAWSALNQLPQNFRFPTSNNFCGQPLNHRIPSFSSYSRIPPPASNQLNFAALNLAGFPPNRPPASGPVSRPGGFPASQGFEPGFNPTFNFGANDSNRFHGRGGTRHF